MKRKEMCIGLCLMLLLGICLVLFFHTKSRLERQDISRVWGGETRYEEISCYFRDDKMVTPSQIDTFRTEALKTLGLSQDAELEESTDWVDAYSTQFSQTVVSDKTSLPATVIGVGNRFFTIHPFSLVSGSYFTPTNLTDNAIVLDEVAAWKLFGSNNIVNQTVTIGTQTFFVTGVVKLQTDIQERDGSTAAFVFVPFSFCDKIRFNANGEKASAYIFAYDVLLPASCLESAYALFQSNFSDKTTPSAIIQTSQRSHLASLALSFFSYWTPTASSGIVYPFWQNIAHHVETQLHLLFSLLVVILVLILLWCCIQIIHYRARACLRI